MSDDHSTDCCPHCGAGCSFRRHDERCWGETLPVQTAVGHDGDQPHPWCHACRGHRDAWETGLYWPWPMAVRTDYGEPPAPPPGATTALPGFDAEEGD